MQKTIHSKEYKYFLSLMIQARTNAGVTQNDLAKQLRRPQSFVSKYENGERRLDVVEYIAVCRALKVDAQKILTKLLKN